MAVFKNGNLNFSQRCCHQSGKEYNSNTTKKHIMINFFFLFPKLTRIWLSLERIITPLNFLTLWDGTPCNLKGNYHLGYYHQFIKRKQKNGWNMPFAWLINTQTKDVSCALNNYKLVKPFEPWAHLYLKVKTLRYRHGQPILWTLKVPHVCKDGSILMSMICNEKRCQTLKWVYKAK